MRNHRQSSATATHKDKLTAVHMLEMLCDIQDEARSDAVMQDFASSIGSAIAILGDLRKAAYAVMVETDANRQPPSRAVSRQKLH